MEKWKTDEFDIKVQKEIQLSIIKTVLQADVKQILKLNMAQEIKKQDKEFEFGFDIEEFLNPTQKKESFRQEEVAIEMKMMGQIRKMYHETNNANKKNGGLMNGLKNLNTSLRKVRSQEEMADINNLRNQIEKYKTFRESSSKGVEPEEDTSFDVEKFAYITRQDKINLLLLKALRDFEWYVKTKSYETGECFG